MLHIWVVLALLAALLPVPAKAAVPAEAAEPPEAPPAPVREGYLLTVDGAEVALPAEPYFLGGRLYIPLRAVSEALGGEVTWDAEGDRALVSAPGLTLTAPFGARWVEANGRCLYVPGAVREENGVSSVPAQVLAAAFGAELSIDAEDKRVDLVSTGVPIVSGEKFYDEEDLYWLSHIIYAESGAEPFEGKIAVGNVVMNRVASEDFPDTVKGVIFDKRFGIQFSPAYSGSIKKEPNRDSVRAAKIALEGETVVPGALYFSPAYRAEKSWAGKNRPYLTQIGKAVFYT